MLFLTQIIVQLKLLLINYMKKNIFIFFISVFMYSQDETCFIYLDAEYISDSGQDRYELVSEKIDSIMNLFSNTVLYVSNGTASSFHESNTFNKNELLFELESSGGLSGTDIMNLSDVKRINDYFSVNKTINLDQSINDKIHLYFIVSYKNLRSNRFSSSFNEKIIKPLLLTNKLYTIDDNPRANCKIHILYDDVSSKKNENFQRINNNITQNYEIKYF